MINKNQILEWLDQLGAKPSEDTADGADWLLRGEFRDIPFVVVKPKDEDVVHIQRGLGVHENDVAKQKEKTIEDREEFLYHLKRDLLLCHTRYNMEFEDEEKTILKRLIIENIIYDDGFSKELFFHKFHNLHDASVLFIINLKRLKWQTS